MVERRPRGIGRGRRYLFDRRGPSARSGRWIDRGRRGLRRRRTGRPSTRGIVRGGPLRRRRHRGRRVGRRGRTDVGHRVGDDRGRRVRFGRGGLRARARRQGAPEEEHHDQRQQHSRNPGLMLAATRCRGTATQNFAVRQRPPTPQRSTYLGGDPASIGAALPKFVSRRTSLLPVHPRLIGALATRAGGLPESTVARVDLDRRVLSARPIEAHLFGGDPGAIGLGTGVRNAPCGNFR